MKDKVFLTPCDEYVPEKVHAAVKAALDAFGGARALAGGKRVLIKANLLMSSTPDKMVTTHPTVIAALAKEFIAAGCTVEIADSCGGVYNEAVLYFKFQELSFMLFSTAFSKLSGRLQKKSMPVNSSSSSIVHI